MKGSLIKITSLKHPLIQHWVSLRKEGGYRKEAKTLLIMGDRIIREFPFPIRSLISSADTDIQAKTKYLVTDAILKKITGLEHYQGMVAEVDIPPPKSVDDCRFVLIVDQIQDPGNLGTLLRTALALGWDGVIATPGTVDFFNDKTLRASQGAIFHLSLCTKTPEEIQQWLQSKKVSLWVADASGSPIGNTSFQTPLALVLSNEGKGMQPWTKGVGTPLAIPLQNNVESLNVAIAGALLLYQIRGTF